RQRNRHCRRDDTHEESGSTSSLAGHPEAAERQHVPKEMIEAIVDPMSRQQPPEFTGGNRGAVVLQRRRERGTREDEHSRQRQKKRGARNAPRVPPDHASSPLHAFGAGARALALPTSGRSLRSPH